MVVGTFSLFVATLLLVKIPGHLLRVALLMGSISFDISESTTGITSKSRSQDSHNMSPFPIKNSLVSSNG